MPIKVERQYSPPASKYANEILSPVVLEEVPRSAEDGYYMTEYFRLPFGIALIPQKNVVIFLCFLGLFVAYIIRICLSQAMIPMSIHYGWEEAIQGHIFAAFYYGYLITQIPGGWVSQIFGSKYVILCGILGSSVLNTLVPAASSNVRLFIAVRMLTGFVQGVRGSLNLKIGILSFLPSFTILLGRAETQINRSGVCDFGTAFGDCRSSGWLSAAGDASRLESALLFNRRSWICLVAFLGLLDQEQADNPNALDHIFNPNLQLPRQR